MKHSKMSVFKMYTFRYPQLLITKLLHLVEKQNLDVSMSNTRSHAWTPADHLCLSPPILCIIFDSQNAFLMEDTELPLCGHPDNNKVYYNI